MNRLPSLHACFVEQGVPRQHIPDAMTAMSVFLEAHLPAFIPWLETQTAAMTAEAETLRLVGGSA